MVHVTLRDFQPLHGIIEVHLGSFTEVIVCAGVRAVVLSVDKEKQRLSLGLKPSSFQGEDAEEGSAAGEEGMPEEDNLDADVLEAIQESSEDEEDDWRAGADILNGERALFILPVCEEDLWLLHAHFPCGCGLRLHEAGTMSAAMLCNSISQQHSSNSCFCENDHLHTVLSRPWNCGH